MAHSFLFRHLVFGLVFSALPTMTPQAQQVGEAVDVQGSAQEDVYALGGTVNVQAAAAGDVVALGGRVAVGETVGGDLLAIGGTVNLMAHVADDVRTAGGDVILNGTVGGDALAAGGNVTLAPGSRVDGRAWLAGGRVDVAGEVGKELKASGGRIVISGKVRGDADLVGESIRILDGAVIEGTLTYRSANEAQIDNGVTIGGGVRYQPVERPQAPIIAVVAGLGLVALLSLLVTGCAMYLLFSRFCRNAVTTLRSEFWKCLGIGLAVFAATPVVVSLLFMTVIGWLPALIVGGLYLLLMLAGFLMGVFYLGQFSFGLARYSDASGTKRLLAFAVALVVVVVLGLIPVLGSLLSFVLLLLGSGVLVLELYRTYSL